jgi:hypothetical protein
VTLPRRQQPVALRQRQAQRLLLGHKRGALG